MSEQQLVTERRTQSLGDIHELQSHRSEMLTDYSMLASMRPYEPNEETIDLLQEFCQALVDYTADAHFRIYRYIDEGKERRQSVVDMATAIYPRILETTDMILDFNEKYDCDEHCDKLDDLEADLSKLGEVLATRTELEDRLISALKKGP